MGTLRGAIACAGKFGRVLQEDFIHAENAAYEARLKLTESRAMVRAFAPSRAETFLNTFGYTLGNNRAIRPCRCPGRWGIGDEEGAVRSGRWHG